jgi:hypothetical protein
MSRPLITGRGAFAEGIRDLVARKTVAETVLSAIW